MVGIRISPERASRLREEYYSKLREKRKALKTLVVEATQRLDDACVNSNLDNILRYVVTRAKENDKFNDVSIGISVELQDFKVEVTSVLVAINELVREGGLMISARSTDSGREFVFVNYVPTTRS